MSPSNNDDAPGIRSADGARPLTRKELRALEKHTGSNSVVPEQAYETGQDPILPEPFLPEQSLPEQSLPEPMAAVPPLPPEPTAGPGVPTPPAPRPAGPAAAVPERGPDPVLPAAPQAPPSIQHTEDPAADPAAAEPVDAGHHTGAGYQVAGHQPEHAPYIADEPYYGSHPADYYYPDEEQHDDVHHETHASPALLAGSEAVVAKPSRKVRRRRRLLALFVTLVVFVAAVAVGAQFLKPLLGNDKPGDFPGPGTGEVTVSVEPGEGTRSMAAKLENEKVVANADTFLSAFTASGGVLSPGEYTFKMEMKNADAVNVLLGKDNGKVIYFALNAGLRVNESLQAISEGSGVPVQQLKELSDAPKQFGLPAKAKNLEGFLAPGEYRFPLGTPAKSILQSLVKVTTDELVAQGITDPAKQYQAVIVASIVQAEGGQADYRDVAGAIYNRLKPNDQTNGYLQVDSAVTYGLGTKSFNFTDEQRADKSNPYNTYANPGLPPGPIGSPGKTAIDAAAKPKSNKYLYWVTINLDTKETKFSSTLAQHNVYVEQYNTWCEANPGRCT